jgi:thiosulfate/3-mercaptopyruvate sulfurtransferase
MIWRTNVIILLIVLAGCKKDNVTDVSEDNDTYLIEADELKTIADQSNIKIIDFRKKEIYEKEHITGALNIWRTDIEDNSYNYKGVMASKQQIEKLFSRLGIENNDTLVIYDDNGLCDAARLWWVLQNYDFKNVRLFHGGIKEWKNNNGKVSSEYPIIKTTVYRLNEKPSLKYYVSKEQVQEVLNNNINNTILLDTRTSDEFSGKKQKLGATKGGRIPNSIHIDWADAINYNGDKRLKSLEELETIYNRLNIKKEDSIIVYCHSGVRSAHTTFVLTQLLGYKNVKNYDGSWIEWSYYNDLPFENDSLTLINN